jgi:hypothetical protein
MSDTRLAQHVLAMALMDTLHKVCLVPDNECRGRVDALAFVEVLKDLGHCPTPWAVNVAAFVISAFEATLNRISRGQLFHKLRDASDTDKRRRDALCRASSIVCGQPHDFGFTIQPIAAAGKRARAQQIERVRDRLRTLCTKDTANKYSALHMLLIIN